MREFASQLLARLVSPAYQVLTTERERVEYSAMMRLLAQRLSREQPTPALHSEAAKELQRLAAKGIVIDNPYEEAVGEVASKLYESLSQALDQLGTLSELNLVYLLTREGSPISRPLMDTRSQDSAEAAKPERVNYAQRHYERAKSFMVKNQWREAVLELRDALKLEPDNSEFHAQLGLAYMEQNLAGMARVSFQKALRINPNERIALQNLSKVGGSEPTPPQGSSGSRGTKSDSAKNRQGGKGGLFGGLFGGKK